MILFLYPVMDLLPVLLGLVLVICVKHVYFLSFKITREAFSWIFVRFNNSSVKMLENVTTRSLKHKWIIFFVLGFISEMRAEQVIKVHGKVSFYYFT